MIQSESFSTKFALWASEVAGAVKLLRSEVSPDGEVGKLNFTLRDSAKLHYAIRYNFTSATPILHKQKRSYDTIS